MSANIVSDNTDLPTIDTLQVKKPKNARRSLESQFETCFHDDKQSDVETESDPRTLNDRVSSSVYHDNDISGQEILSETSSKTTITTIKPDEYLEYCDTNKVKIQLFKEEYASPRADKTFNCSSITHRTNSTSRTPSFHEAISRSLISMEEDILRKEAEVTISRKKKSKSKDSGTKSIVSLPSPYLLAQTSTPARDHDQTTPLMPQPTAIENDGVLCRICHDGEYREELVSPCYCTGSVGALHITCLEKWLGTSNTTKCELCKYEFKVKMKRRSFNEFLQYPTSVSERKNLICDLMCFLVLTPLTVTSAFLCIRGVAHFAQAGDKNWEVVGLSSLTGCLITIYIIWCCIASKHHVQVFQNWRRSNQIIKIIYLSPTKGRQVLQTQTIVDANNNQPRSPAHNTMIHTPYTLVSGSESLEPQQTGNLKSILRYSASTGTHSQPSRSVSRSTIMWGPDSTDTNLDPQVVTYTGSEPRDGVVRETNV